MTSNTDIVKKSFANIINNPSITLFLVIFLILINILAPYVYNSKSPYISAILMLCAFLLSCVFLSGWFQVIKESLDEKNIKEKNFGAIFLEGTGKNIVSITICTILLCLILNITLFLVRLFSLKMFGSVDFIAQDLSLLPQDSDAIAKYIQNLQTDKLYAIYGWMFTGIFAMSILSFLFLFYMPAVIDNTKSNVFLKPFIALKDAICFVFKNFLGAIAVYFILTIIYLIMTVINAILIQHIAGMFLSVFLYIYFVSFFVMLIFNYYEQKNCCNNGCDCVGEDKTCDTISKDD